jgi:hypothetical protein
MTVEALGASRRRILQFMAVMPVIATGSAALGEAPVIPILETTDAATPFKVSVPQAAIDDRSPQAAWMIRSARAGILG